MTASRDRPGPHPDNQRKRSELRGPRNALIGALVVVAVLAVAVDCGLGAVLPRSGEASVDSLLIGSRVVATILLLVVAATQAMAAALLAIHHVRARMAALAAALISIAWGSLQVLVLDQASWFQLALIGVGALEALLVAGCTPRDARSRKWRRQSKRAR